MWWYDVQAYFFLPIVMSYFCKTNIVSHIVIIFILCYFKYHHIYMKERLPIRLLSLFYVYQFTYYYFTGTIQIWHISRSRYSFELNPTTVQRKSVLHTRAHRSAAPAKWSSFSNHCFFRAKWIRFFKLELVYCKTMGFNESAGKGILCFRIRDKSVTGYFYLD